MTLAAGRLCHRIDIEQQVTVRDPDTGEAIVSWVPFASSVAAEVVPRSAKEFIAAQATQSQVSARITIRYRSGLLATMRILHRGRTYNIAGVLPDAVSGLEYVTLPVVDMGPAPVTGSHLLFEDGSRMTTEADDLIILEQAA